MYILVITLTFTAAIASAETPVLYYQSLVDFTLAITLIESQCVISACSDKAWHDLKLTSSGRRIIKINFTMTYLVLSKSFLDSESMLVVIVPLTFPEFHFETEAKVDFPSA